MSSKLAFQAHDALVREDCLRKQRQEESIGAGISASRKIADAFPMGDLLNNLYPLPGIDIVSVTEDRSIIAYNGNLFAIVLQK